MMVEKISAAEEEDKCFELLKQSQTESCLYYEFSYGDFKYLAKKLRVQELQHSAHLIRRSDEAKFLTFILTGACEVRDKDGHTIGNVMPGDIVGELGLFTGISRKTDIVVSTPDGAMVASLDYEEIPTIYQEQADLGLRLMRVLSRVSRYHAMLIGCEALGPEPSFEVPPLEPGPAQDQAKEKFVQAVMAVQKASFGLGSSVGRAQLEILVQYMKEWQVPKGTKVFTKGSRGTSVLFILEGKMSVQAKDGSSLFTLEKGALIGARPYLMLKSSPHSLRDHDVVTVENTTLAVFPREMLDSLGTAHPKVAHALFLHLVSQCIGIENRPFIAQDGSEGFPQAAPLLITPGSNRNDPTEEEVFGMLMYCRAYTQWMDELTQDEAQKLAKVLQLIVCAEEGGPVLCSRWDAKGLHVVLAGKVCMNSSTRDELELEAGHWLGELEWSEKKRKWNCNVRASQAGTVIGVLLVDRLAALFLYEPRLALKIVRLACNCCWLNKANFLHTPLDINTRTQQVDDLPAPVAEMDKYSDTLAQFFDPESFDSSVLAQITAAMTVRKMGRFETIVSAGERLAYLVVVLEGTVEAVENSSKEVTYMPGEVLAPHHLLVDEAVTFEHRSGGMGCLLLLISWDLLKKRFLLQEDVGHVGYALMYALITKQMKLLSGGAIICRPWYPPVKVVEELLLQSEEVANNTVSNEESDVFSEEPSKEDLSRLPKVQEGGTLPNGSVPKEGTSGTSKGVPEEKPQPLPEVKASEVNLVDAIPLEEKISILMTAQRSSEYWRMLNHEEMIIIAEFVKVLRIPEGERVCARGEPAMFMGLVLSGEVTADIGKNANSGKKYHIGEFFGVQNYFTKNSNQSGRASHFISNGSNTLVGIFINEQMQKFLKRDEVVAMKLHRLFSHLSQNQLKNWTIDYKSVVDHGKGAAKFAKLREEYCDDDKLSRLTKFMQKHRSKWSPDETSDEFTELQTEKKVLASIVDIVHLTPGETILRFRETKFCIYMLVEGEVIEDRVMSEDKMGLKQPSSEFSSGRPVNTRGPGDYIGEGLFIQRMFQVEDLAEEYDWICTQSGPAVMVELNVKTLLENREALPYMYSKFLKDLGAVCMKTLWEVYQMHFDKRAISDELLGGYIKKNIMDRDLQNKMLHGLTFGNAKLPFDAFSSNIGTDAKLELLKKLTEASRFWYGFNDNELRIIASMLEYREFGEGEFFSKTTDTIHYSGIVARGKMMVYFYNQSKNSEVKGEATSIAEIYPGNLVGHLCMFQGGVRTTDMRSVQSDTVVLQLSPDNLTQLMKTEPGITHRLLGCFLKSAISLVKESSLDIQQRHPPRAHALPRDRLYQMADEALRKNKRAFGNSFKRNEIYKIMDHMFISRYKYGETIYYKGDEGMSTAFILDGVVEMKVDSGTWKHQGMSWRTHGGWIGEVAFTDSYMTRLARTASIVAGTDNLFLGIVSNQQLEALCKAEPSIGIRFLHLLSSSQVEKARDQLKTILQESSDPNVIDHLQAMMEFPVDVDKNAPALESFLARNHVPIVVKAPKHSQRVKHSYHYMDPLKRDAGKGEWLDSWEAPWQHQQPGHSHGPPIADQRNDKIQPTEPPPALAPHEPPPPQQTSRDEKEGAQSKGVLSTGRPAEGSINPGQPYKSSKLGGHPNIPSYDKQQFPQGPVKVSPAAVPHQARHLIEDRHTRSDGSQFKKRVVK